MILEVSDIKTASSNKTLPIKAGFLEKKTTFEQLAFLKILKQLQHLCKVQY